MLSFSLPFLCGSYPLLAWGERRCQCLQKWRMWSWIMYIQWEGSMLDSSKFTSSKKACCIAHRGPDPYVTPVKCWKEKSSEPFVILAVQKRGGLSYHSWMVLTVFVIGRILPQTYINVIFRICYDLVIDKAERLSWSHLFWENLGGSRVFPFWAFSYLKEEIL